MSVVECDYQGPDHNSNPDLDDEDDNPMEMDDKYFVEKQPPG